MQNRPTKSLKNNKGFSFVELIAVLIIIAILASIGVPVYLEQVKNARAAEAQTTIGAIKTSVKMYRQKYGRVPGDLEDLVKKGFLEIDRATETKWNFEFTKSRDNIQTITATSTESMPGGSGHSVSYDAETGKWSGYGQAEE